MLYFPYEKKQKPAGFPTGFLFWEAPRIWKNLEFVDWREDRPLSIADFCLLRTHVVLVHASVARGIIGTYYAPPLGRTGLSVCPYFAFLQASLRYFFGLVFFDNSPLPARYQNKYDNSPAKLDSLQVLVEGHRFFRFPFRFTAGRDAPLFSVLAFFGGDAPLSYNMQKNFVSEQKVHWISSVDNVDNYALFYYCFSTLKRISKRVSGTAICTTCFVDFQEHKIF